MLYRRYSMKNFLGYLILIVAVTRLSIACTGEFSKGRYGWKFAGKSQPWFINFDENHIEVKTTAELGSDKRLRMAFRTLPSEDAGGIFIKFSLTPKYKLGWCGDWLPIPVELPARNSKTWKIEKTNYNVVVSCNNKMVINTTASDETCDKWVNWRTYWDRKPVKIRFNKQLDSASKQYRINNKRVPQWIKRPGGYSFDLDLQYTSVELKTQSLFGSNHKISLYFQRTIEEKAGGIEITFSKTPKYRLMHCSSTTAFSKESLKKLRKMPREKIWAVRRTIDGVEVLVNGKKILNTVVSDTFCLEDKSWRTYWGRRVERVRFYRDTATRFCRVSKLRFPVRTSPPPRPKRRTTTPEKGAFWYGSPVTAPVEPPTKHSPPSHDYCWMNLVTVGGATKLAESAWTGEEECERLCIETAGCHVAFLSKKPNSRNKVCEVYGVYNLDWQHKDTLYGFYEEGIPILAERKCFDPNFYKQDNSVNPCGWRSFECKDRCIDLQWRCDGERDCKEGEDEENCPSYDSPFCPEGQWRCSNFLSCPLNIPWWKEDRPCPRCIDKSQVCDSNLDCFHDEDERPEDCHGVENWIRRTRPIEDVTPNW